MNVARALDSFEVVRTHLFQQVADRIEQLIIDRDLRAGDRLPSERTLAQTLGVSRPTISEAFRILADRGMVEVRVGSGTFVAGLTTGPLAEALTRLVSRQHNPYHELQEIRVMLEPEIAARAARTARPEDIARLDQLVTELDAPNHDAETHAVIDVAFHVALVEATHNQMLVALFSPLMTVMKRTIRDIREEVKRREDHQLLNPQHRRILDAVRSGSPERARAAMHKHIAAAEAILRHLTIREGGGKW